MIKISKFTAFRLVSILMFPYSANAAAECVDLSNYNFSNDSDYAYETAAYSTDACPARAAAAMFSDSANAFSI